MIPHKHAGLASSGPQTKSNEIKNSIWARPRLHFAGFPSFAHIPNPVKGGKVEGFGGAGSAGGRCNRWTVKRTTPWATANVSGPAANGVKQGSASVRRATAADGAEDDFLAAEGDGGARQATTRRLKMVVAYDGCEFAGFQFQAGKVRTVQGELERCAKRLFHGCSRMVGASRTDGGAHAYGQVVHFDVYGTRDSLESDALYYNSFLPPDVRVLGLSYAEEGFDSHFSSCGKTYLYKFAAGLPDPLQSKYRWWVYDRWCERSRGKPGRLSDVELDVGLMQQAADLLLGRHDFSAFMDKKRPAGLGSAKRKTPKLAERRIKPERTAAKNTRILSQLRLHESSSPVSEGQEVLMEVTGDGFLYRMVRMLAAGLVEVGHRRITPTALGEVLRLADRSMLPEAAPPHGLYLARVHYPGEPDFEFRIQSFARRIRNGSVGSSSLSPSQSPLVVLPSGQNTDLESGVEPHQEGDGGRPTSIGQSARQGGSGGGGDVDGGGGGEEGEVEALLRELRQTQGQKAAALMRAAAEERRWRQQQQQELEQRGGGEGGYSGNDRGGGGDDDALEAGGRATAAIIAITAGSRSSGSSHSSDSGSYGGSGDVIRSYDAGDREDDQ